MAKEALGLNTTYYSAPLPPIDGIVCEHNPVYALSWPLTPLIGTVLAFKKHSLGAGILVHVKLLLAKHSI